MSEHEKQKENIEVVVVVSGQSERLKVNLHQTLEQLVHEALQKSGNQGLEANGATNYCGRLNSYRP